MLATGENNVNWRSGVQGVCNHISSDAFLNLHSFRLAQFYIYTALYLHTFEVTQLSQQSTTIED